MNAIIFVCACVVSLAVGFIVGTRSFRQAVLDEHQAQMKRAAESSSVKSVPQ